MSETKRITALHVITDSENYYDHIGDIDGGYIDPEWLKAHITSHGAEQLLTVLAYMNKQIFDAIFEINMEKSEENNRLAAKIDSSISEDGSTITLKPGEDLTKHHLYQSGQKTLKHIADANSAIDKMFTDLPKTHL